MGSWLKRLIGGKPSSSEAFERFHQNFLSSSYNDQYHAWHDGLDVGVLKALSAAEREQAEQLMLGQLQKGDVRAAVGLGVMRSQKAVEPLKKLFKQRGGVEVAQALWRIERFPEAEDYLIAVLRDSARHNSSRIDAAGALWDFRTPKTSQALQEVIQSDNEYLVRYNAGRALLVIHGYDWQTADKHLGKLAPLLARSPAEAVRELATLIADKPF